MNACFVLAAAIAIVLLTAEPDEPYFAIGALLALGLVAVGFDQWLSAFRKATGARR